MRKRIAIIVGILVVGAVLLSVKMLRDSQASTDLTLSGTIEADDILIGSRLGGRIGEVLVSEGERVSAGQVIVRLEAGDLESRRAEALSAIAAANATLDKAVHGPLPEEVAEVRAVEQAAGARLERARNGTRPQEIEQAEANLRSAEADLTVAKATYARVSQLAEGGVVSRQQHDEARAQRDRAQGQRDAAADRLRLLRAGTRREEIAETQRDFDRARARRELVERGTRDEDISKARADLERAQAGLQRIEIDMKELEVRAPADAFVEVLQVRPGDLVAPNGPVATLVEVERLWVKVYVAEPELGRVRLEGDARVTVDTFPNEAFPGRVEHISNKGEFTPRNVQTREERNHQVFAVRVRLLKTDRLRPGMAADVVL